MTREKEVSTESTATTQRKSLFKYGVMSGLPSYRFRLLCWYPAINAGREENGEVGRRIDSMIGTRGAKLEQANGSKHTSMRMG